MYSPCPWFDVLIKRLFWRADVVHQLRFCLASMSEQQRPLLHAADILQAAKVPSATHSHSGEFQRGISHCSTITLDPS